MTANEKALLKVLADYESIMSLASNMLQRADPISKQVADEIRKVRSVGHATIRALDLGYDDD